MRRKIVKVKLTEKFFNDNPLLVARYSLSQEAIYEAIASEEGLKVIVPEGNSVGTIFISNDGAQEVKPKIAQKKDDGKLMMDLISSDFLDAISEILTFGAKKYSKNNWRQGFDWTRVYAAIQRHLKAWNNPYESDLDPETGKSHLWHAAVGLMFLVEHEIRDLGTDDRHKVKTHKCKECQCRQKENEN
jgi:hypothetical protein